MNAFLNVLVTWFFLGFLFLVVFVIMEIIAIITRPEYMESKSMDKPMPSMARFLAMWFTIWPWAAYVIIQALIRNQTPTEYLDAQEKRRSEVKASAKKVIENARKAVSESSFVWHIFVQPQGRFMLLMRNLSGSYIPTHMIYLPTEPDKRVVCMHAMPDPAHSVPFRFLDNVEGSVDQAVKLCLEDVDWAHLCVPGLEDARKKCWQAEVIKSKGRHK
jgi:hypothetical protein